MSEGLLLLILGLIFLKPDQFSQTARWLGQKLREARKMGKTFSQTLLQDSDLKDFREAAKSVTEAVSAGKKAIRDATDLGSATEARPAKSASKSAEQKADSSLAVSSPSPSVESPEERSAKPSTADPAESSTSHPGPKSDPSLGSPLDSTTEKSDL